MEKTSDFLKHLMKLIRTFQLWRNYTKKECEVADDMISEVLNSNRMFLRPKKKRDMTGILHF